MRAAVLPPYGPVNQLPDKPSRSAPSVTKSQHMRRQPPRNDPVEEHARFECMRLIREGTLDNWTVFRQREAGVPWSKIRDEAPTQG
jgi:hypothetical protein